MVAAVHQNHSSQSTPKKVYKMVKNFAIYLAWSGIILSLLLAIYAIFSKKLTQKPYYYLLVFFVLDASIQWLSAYLYYFYPLNTFSVNPFHQLKSVFLYLFIFFIFEKSKTQRIVGILLILSAINEFVSYYFLHFEGQFNVMKTILNLIMVVVALLMLRKFSSESRSKRLFKNANFWFSTAILIIDLVAIIINFIGGLWSDLYKEFPYGVLIFSNITTNIYYILMGIGIYHLKFIKPNSSVSSN
jgi:hypothetical protein